MAYDPVARTLVLFGGVGGPSENWHSSQTWLWNGRTWTKATPPRSPPPRVEAVMAFDAASGQMILFGGQTPSGRVLGDTWTWTGSTWRRLHPAHAPPASGGQLMAYDPADRSLVLFGGYSLRPKPFRTDSATWVWNGRDWVRKSPLTSPPGRSLAAMAWDGSSHRLVLFGGGNVFSGNSMFSDTWAFTGSDWVELQPSRSPSPRFSPALVYDPEQHELVLFGGYVVPSGNDFADTWTWR